ncbi:hypothetical protein BG015_007254 [Linnemannia schmuckeri]|uniref:Uncharacterized protein n=1 Tax=Linnemannia schmuckeri TaxID=64567 RepID=A0A9P5S1G6_9FUNG|nr:hypothetical protein BG015_007254 [Linnemannia schmuckeri]
MAYQQYQLLNAQIIGYIRAIRVLEIRERSQYKVLLAPPSPPYGNTPAAFWKLITSGRGWERQRLWETRNQIYSSCMALQSCLEPVGGGGGCGNDGEVNSEEVMRNQELKSRFSLAA